MTNLPYLPDPEALAKTHVRWLEIQHEFDVINGILDQAIALADEKIGHSASQPIKGKDPVNS